MLLQLLIDRTGWVANFAFCWLQNTKLWPTMMHFYCKWCCFICNNLVQLIHILGISSAKEGKKHQCMSCKTSKDLNGVSAFVLVYMSYSSLTIVLFFFVCFGRLNGESRRLFEELGSTAVKELAFRDSWVFVGAKGIENKSPFEQVWADSCAPSVCYICQ